ncbi:Acyl-CoA:1-acyl-sn-glycerol-3-phosphate acyltransferase [hydrothermal vent metagenome]|uniref:Acyl-CoA:1-acyl-sn-glycerol-3-phosphate acyltransferase n=1 Tax=hydrothermal vent metagenome TaxID=652676 RepID=A0A3B0WCU7_9ZZZZ
MRSIWFLRSVLFAFGQTVSLVIFSLVGQVTRLCSFKTRYHFMHYWARFCLLWLRWTCGIRYRLHGQENIKTDQAGLILARHESTWETLALQEIFPRQAYVLKKELLNIPFFGWGMALLNPIAIDRSAGRKALTQLVSEGKERLNNGDWVVIFPEGTRMPANQLGKIHGGGALLATKAKAPVYLVAHNAGEYWAKNSFIKRPGVIDIYISPALDIAGLSASEINHKIADWFESHMFLIHCPRSLSEN